jgi:hypothetical protein
VYSVKKDSNLLTNEKKSDININKEDTEDTEDIFDCTESNIDKRGKKRGRWFTMILYPDNSYHMDFLTYVDGGRREIYKDFQAFWIFHTKEKDEKKDHFHLQLYFANERSVSGVCKMLGRGDYYSPDGKTYKALFDKTGFPEEIKIFQKDNMSPSLCSVVSDIHSYYVYLMHKDYPSYLKCKRVYQENDFKFTEYDYDLIKYLMQKPDRVEEMGSELSELMMIIKEYGCYSMTNLCETLCCNNLYKLIKYVEKHSYLVNTLIKGRGYKI